MRYFKRHSTPTYRLQGVEGKGMPKSANLLLYIPTFFFRRFVLLEPHLTQSPFRYGWVMRNVLCCLILLLSVNTGASEFTPTPPSRREVIKLIEVNAGPKIGLSFITIANDFFAKQLLCMCSMRETKQFREVRQHQRYLDIHLS